ncbi:MAG: enoyl-CoA hydratase-related protein [bacterium]
MRLIGTTRAKLFIMTGRRIPARQAEEWGLVTQCVPEEEFEAAVESLASELAALAPLALRTLKTVLNKGMDAPLETALELERKAYAWLRTTEDYSEGVNAFFDKRKPEFKGR